MVMFEKLFGKNLQTEKKIGFRIPFDEWLQAKDELRKFCAEILLKSNKIKELNNIEIEKLEKILSSNNKLDENQIRITWVLTNYIMWRISL